MSLELSSKKTLNRTLVLIAAAARLASTPAVANVTVSQYTDSNHFNFQRIGIPDLDQVRVGVPNQGACYCVPTSTMNMLMYMANHGFPQVAPGPGSWTGYDTYYDVSSYLDDLAELMQICPGGDDPDCSGGACDEDGDCTLSCGGGGSAAFDGLIEWLGPEADKFNITMNYASGNWAPRLHYIAQIAVSPGAPLMRVSYGRYATVSYTPGGDPIRKRSGGHAVTFAGAFANGNEKYLSTRDPAQDEEPSDVFGQSPFTTQQYEVDDFYVRLTSQSGGIIWSWTERWMSGLDEPHNDGKMRLLDGVVTIRPKTGYSFTETDIVVIPLGGFGFGVEAPPPSLIDVALPIVDCVPDADGLGLVALTGPAGGAPSIKYVNPTRGDIKTIADLPGAVAIATGRQNDLYALINEPNGCQIRRFAPAPGGDLGDYEQRETLELPSWIRGGAFDDRQDMLLVVTADHKLYRIPRNLGSEVDPIFADVIPSAVPLGMSLCVAPDPTDGTVWLASTSSDQLFGLSMNAAGGMAVQTFAPPQIQDPTSVAFDDSGRMFVRAAAGVFVFERHSATGAVDPRRRVCVRRPTDRPEAVHLAQPHELRSGRTRHAGLGQHRSRRAAELRHHHRRLPWRPERQR